MVLCFDMTQFVYCSDFTSSQPKNDSCNILHKHTVSNCAVISRLLFCFLVASSYRSPSALCIFYLHLVVCSVIAAFHYFSKLYDNKLRALEKLRLKMKKMRYGASQKLCGCGVGVDLNVMKRIWMDMSMSTTNMTSNFSFYYLNSSSGLKYRMDNIKLAQACGFGWIFAEIC